MRWAVVGCVLWAVAPASAQEAELAREIEAASRAYAELRLEDAWVAIEHAALRIEEAPEPPPRHVRVQVHVLEAAIARARADLSASDAALDRALALDPTLALDPALHPPPLLDALERRRAAQRPASADEAPHAATSLDLPGSRAISADDAARAVSISGSVGASGEIDRGGDPWPWIGLGVGGAVLLGGVIALSVVLAQPPASFDVRGTIVP